MAESLVIDCSVAAKWVLPEPGRPAARLLLDRAGAGEITMLAPDLILVEFASLLSKQHRRKLISAAVADKSFDLFTQIAPTLVDTRPRLDAALALSFEYGASLWDCVYVVLAIECECPCLTADKRLLRSPIGKHANLRLLD